MSTSKNHRNGLIESHRRGRLAEKSSSFHSHTVAAGTMSGGQIQRPKTVPDLVPVRKHAVVDVAPPRQRPKLLVKVTMMGSLGPVQVVMPPESTVEDLVAAAVRQYVKEGRRPILPSTDHSDFDLHYSQFSLESKYLFFLEWILSLTLLFSEILTIHEKKIGYTIIKMGLRMGYPSLYFLKFENFFY